MVAAIVAAAAITSSPQAVRVPRCATKQLRVHYVSGASVATLTRVALAYTNVSSRRCALWGWPRVVATDSTGRVRDAIRTGMIPTFQPELRDESQGPGVPAVVLGRGESAYSFLAAEGVYASSSRPCPSYVRLTVALPRSAESVTLSGWVAGHLNGFIPACDRPLVSQVLPRSEVRLFGG
ncbi:MAG TPA: DUF4232 domain-containing protein [Gaiellaceae bacterium]